MSIDWGKVAEYAAAAYSAYSASESGKSAGKKAKKGSKAELALIRESRDMVRADTRHTRQAGATALNALMNLTGLSGSGGGAQYDENGWPVENTGGAMMPPASGQESPTWQNPDAMAVGRYDTAFAGRALGGPMNQDTIYNINEMGPENVYRGGSYTRGRGPATIDGETGYVEPNVEGAAYGQIIINALSGGDKKKKIGSRPNTDWQYNDKGKIAKTGYGHWNNDLAAYVDRRGRVKGKQAAPPEGWQDPATQTDIDTTQGTDYNFQTDPGYQFRFEEGQRALDRGAAARGGLLSGGYGRKAIRYGQGFASNEYTNVYNRIANIAGMGQVANQFAGNATMQGGFGMGNAASNAGNASAYGQQLSGNAIAGGINQLSQVDWSNIFNQGRNTPVGGPVDSQGYGGALMGPPR